MKNYNENYVREAAYYNWQNAGCPSGKDEYFWNMAMNQLYGTSKKSSSCKSSTSKSCSSSTKTCTKKASTMKKTSTTSKK